MSGPPRGEQPALVIQPRVPRAFADLAGAAAVTRLAAELPSPATLAPGGWVAIGRGTTEAASWFRRGREQARGVDLDVRCSALLLRGYVEICAAGDMAYGRAPDQPCAAIALSFS